MGKVDYVKFVLFALVVISFIVVSAVSFHSVEEIHYLKSYYPRDFSVEEVKDATIVELIKVVLITFPLVLLMSLCMYYLKKNKK